MSDTAETGATGGEQSAPLDLSAVKAQFAAALTDAPAEETAPEPEKPPSKPEVKPEPEPDAEPDEDTNAARARFRAERRAVKQRAAELDRQEAEQRELFATERRVWQQARAAAREGRPLEVLQALGIDPEDLAKQLTETAVGNDPATRALQRKLAEIEAQQERERHEHEQRSHQQSLAAAQRGWEGEVARVLANSGDETLTAIAADPELVSQVRLIQEEWYADGDTNQRSARAMQKAARELARRLESEHTRLSRYVRRDGGSQTGGEKPSAAGQLQRPRETRSTRTLGASQGSAKPQSTPKFDTSTDAGRLAWKRYHSEILKNSNS